MTIYQPNKDRTTIPPKAKEELIINKRKCVLKLDKNFHVYIHGSKSKIELSQDKKGKFVKLYYNEIK
ncbi:MAG: hypothetical protein N4A49_01875 [Marinifilaceae bacterium]|jgi:hypothetical protein|nr:hypothetical protein [Marinifilaceae bacterium]